MKTPTKNASMHDWAKFYSEEWGASVIPLREGKLPAVAWLEYRTRKPTPEELRRWFVLGNPYGMAIVCGEVSDWIVRLDFDRPVDLRTLGPHLPTDAPTFKSQRKGGGYGVLVQTLEPVGKVAQGQLSRFPELEINGEGTITVVPPTPGYEWMKLPGKPPPFEFVSFLRAECGYEPKQVHAVEGRPLTEDDVVADILANTKEGERDHALIRLANILRAKDIGLEAVIQMVVPSALNWESESPMSEDEIARILTKGYNQYKHEGARLRPVEEEFESRRFDASKRPKFKTPPTLVEGLIMGGDMANVVLAAFTSSGKTTLVTAMGVCMARGLPVLGALKVPKPMRIVYIDQEQVVEQVYETLDHLSAVYGRPDPGMMTILSGAHNAYGITRPKSLEKLAAELCDIKPDFVFLDGWQWFVGGKHLDHEATNRALDWWKGMRMELSFGLCIIHHTRKKGDPRFAPENPLELSSGAQTLMDQARTKLVFEHIADYEDYGWLHGNCGRAAWNPVSFVTEYDRETQSHRIVPEGEVEDIFPNHVRRKIFGAKSGKGAEAKSLLNRLNRAGMQDVAVAESLGLNKSSVSKWRTGNTKPSEEKLEALRELARKTEKLRKQAKMPRGFEK